MSSLRFPLAYRDFVVGALLLSLPLGLLGEGLVTRTHHRPLGAATFASLALLALLAVAFVPARLRAASAPLAGHAERALWALGALSLLLAAVRALSG